VSQTLSSEHYIVVLISGSDRSSVLFAKSWFYSVLKILDNDQSPKKGECVSQKLTVWTNKTLYNFNWHANSQNKHYNNSCPTNAATDAVNSEWNFTYFFLPFSNTSRWIKTTFCTKAEWWCVFKLLSLEN